MGKALSSSFCGASLTAGLHSIDLGSIPSVRPTLQGIDHGLRVDVTQAPAPELTRDSTVPSQIDRLVLWTIQNAPALLEAAQKVLVPHKDLRTHHPHDLHVSILHVVVEEVDQANFFVTSAAINHTQYLEPHFEQVGLGSYFKHAVLGEQDEANTHPEVAGTLKVVVELPSAPPHGMRLIIRQPITHYTVGRLRSVCRDLLWETNLQNATSCTSSHQLPSIPDPSDHPDEKNHVPIRTRESSMVDHEMDDDYLVCTTEPLDRQKMPVSWHYAEEAPALDATQAQYHRTPPPRHPTGESSNDSEDEVELLLRAVAPEQKCLNCALLDKVTKTAYVCGLCRHARYCVSLHVTEYQFNNFLLSPGLPTYSRAITAHINIRSTTAIDASQSLHFPYPCTHFVGWTRPCSSGQFGTNIASFSPRGVHSCQGHMGLRRPFGTYARRATCSMSQLPLHTEANMRSLS